MKLKNILLTCLIAVPLLSCNDYLDVDSHQAIVKNLYLAKIRNQPRIEWCMLLFW